MHTHCPPSTHTHTQGLETAESKVTDPRKTEFDYKFGLMSSFQDRNVDVKPVQIEIESAAMRIRQLGEIRI